MYTGSTDPLHALYNFIEWVFPFAKQSPHIPYQPKAIEGRNPFRLGKTCIGNFPNSTLTAQEHAAAGTCCYYFEGELAQTSPKVLHGSSQVPFFAEKQNGDLGTLQIFPIGLQLTKSKSNQRKKAAASYS